MKGIKERKIKFGFQSIRESEFPVLVQIALLHYICNSKCKKCPVGLYRSGEIGQDNKGEFDPKKKIYLQYRLFLKIVNEMNNYTWSILRLHGRGEPLMHPYYIAMITAAKKAEIQTVTSFTNAVLLDNKMAESILDAKLDLLECSVDGYSEKFYKEFRRTDYFSQVVSNVENFIRARNRRGRKCKTRVIVSAVDCPEFQLEKEKFLNYWEAMADKVIIRPYHTYGGRLKSICEADSLSQEVPCAQLWTRFSINPCGKVNACFNDWADDEIIGDLNNEEASIAKIWRNEKFENIRKASLEKQSILKCCGNCLATKNGWIYTYQLLLKKLRNKEPNFNFK